MSMVSQPQTRNEVAANQRNDQARYHLTPVVDIRSTADGYELRAEMPGVGKDGVELTVDNGQLTLIGHRRPAQAGGQCIYRERRELDYRRVYELDPSIDTARISAKMEQGVLTVTLPKAESVKPRRITLQ
jgi:HSP20 family protein